MRTLALENPSARSYLVMATDQPGALIRFLRNSRRIKPPRFPASRRPTLQSARSDALFLPIRDHSGGWLNPREKAVVERGPRRPHGEIADHRGRRDPGSEHARALWQHDRRRPEKAGGH